MRRLPKGFHKARLPRHNSKLNRYKATRQQADCDVCGWTAPLHQWQVMHLHHIVPVACGGFDEPTNLLILCPTHHTLIHRLFRVPRRGETYLGPTSKWQLCRLVRLYQRRPADALAKIARLRNRQVINVVRPFLEDHGRTPTP